MICSTQQMAQPEEDSEVTKTTEHTSPDVNATVSEPIHQPQESEVNKTTEHTSHDVNATVSEPINQPKKESEVNKTPEKTSPDLDAVYFYYQTLRRKWMQTTDDELSDSDDWGMQKQKGLSQYRTK